MQAAGRKFRQYWPKAYQQVSSDGSVALSSELLAGKSAGSEPLCLRPAPADPAAACPAMALCFAAAFLLGLGTGFGRWALLRL